MNNAGFISILTSGQHEFFPVVPFDPGKDKFLQLDFTSNNAELSEDVFRNTRVFAEYINRKLENENCRYGIGGYAEHRTLYSRSKIFDRNLSSPLSKSEVISEEKESDAQVEPRRLHLGTDIWGKPNTAVMAPLNGIVHSFAFNDRPGDYGATIILTHQLQGVSFYTLYGHLSLNSIKNISEGDRVMKGDIFADFGLPNENGQWPPHLHFQVIRDLQGWNGDYPGVCKYSEKEMYLDNCPDPDIILQLNRFCREC